MKRILFSVVCLLTLCCLTATSQNFCAEATEIVCNQTVRANNFQSGNGLTALRYGSCLGGINISSNPFSGNDRVFKLEFFPEITSELTIDCQFLRNSGDLDLFVFKGCEEDAACFGRSLNSGRTSERVVVPNAFGVYYIVIDGANNRQFNEFLVRVTCTETPQEQCDDNPCADAIPLSCGQSITANNFGTGDNFNRRCNYENCYDQSNSALFDANDMVYRFDAPANVPSVDITLTGLRNDLDMFLFKDGCGLDQCQARSINDGTEGERIRINEPSGTYYIVIDGHSEIVNSNFTIAIECAEEDPCFGAIPIACGQTMDGNNLETGNNLNTTLNYNNCRNGNATFNGNDVIYRLDVPNLQELVTVTVSNLSADLDLFVFEGTCEAGGCLSSSLSSNQSNEVIEIPNAQGVYYLVVDAFKTTQFSSFTMNVECKPACQANVNPDCDEIEFYRRTGSGANPLFYVFEGELAAGTWTATGAGFNNGNQPVLLSENGPDKQAQYTFPRGGTYTICHEVTGSDGCPVQCCKTILIGDDECDQIRVNYTGQGNTFDIGLGADLQSAYLWRSGGGEPLGSGQGKDFTNNFNVDSGNDCIETVCVSYFDEEKQAWRYCCADVWVCDTDCAESIDYEYDEASANWVFTFSEETSRPIYWRMADTEEDLGSGASIRVETPTPCDGRSIVATYYDDAEGAWKNCILPVFLCNPYNCDDIFYSYDESSNSYNLNMPGINASNIIQWRDDDTGRFLGSSASVSINVDNNCRARNFSVKFFDPGVNRYRICCIRLFICNPYNCDDIFYSYNNSNNSYQLTMPGIGAENILEWRDDDTGQSLGGGATVDIDVDGNCRARNFSVKFFDSAVGYYRICCIRLFICNPYDCNDIFYSYNNTNNRYQLTIPGISAENVIEWRDDDTGQSLGTETTVNVPVTNNCESRNFSVKFFDPAVGYYRICCIRLFICDPYDCDLITEEYSASDNAWTVRLPGIDNANILQWRNDDTGQTIATGTNIASVAAPSGSGCVNVSVLFFDPGVNSYRVCCIQLCFDPCCSEDPLAELSWLRDIVEDLERCCDGNNEVRVQQCKLNGRCVYVVPLDCRQGNTGGKAFYDCEGNDLCDEGDFVTECDFTSQLTDCRVIWECPVEIVDPKCDGISFLYTGSNGSLRYGFSVADGTPSGRWTATGGAFGANVVNLGTASSINHTFPREDVYTICYEYKNSAGALVKCCKTVFITADPNACTSITYTYNGATRRYEVTIPNTIDGDVVEWVDDLTREYLGNTSTISVPVTSNCQTRILSVTYYDAALGYYQICCIRLFICDPYNCDLITESYSASANAWTVELPGIANENILRWRNDDTGQTIASGTSTTTVPAPNGAGCVNVSVLFYDPATNSSRVCCIQLCFDPCCSDNPLAELPWLRTIVDELERCCEGNREVRVQQCKLNGRCVYVVPLDCRRGNSGGKAFYDCEGNDLCDEGNFVTECDFTNQLTDCRIIWECPVEIVDPKCDDISFLYTGANGSLRYSFSVPNGTPSGRWTATGGAFGSNVVGLGTARSINHTFPREDVYTICYEYKNSAGALVKCCKTVFITADPNACTSVTYTYNATTRRYEVTIPNTIDSDVVEWVDDRTREYLGNTSTISVPVTDDCRTRILSVTYYDAALGYYQICCLRLFICDPFNCNLITESFNTVNNAWTVELPGIANENILRWRNDDTGETLASGTNTTTVDRGNATCINVSVLFYDPATNSSRVCCIELCVDPCCPDDPLAQLPWLRDIVEDLERCCDGNTEVIVEQCRLNGQCVYVVPKDCRQGNTGGKAFYDCEGNDLCDEGNFVTECDFTNQLTDCRTIWSCPSITVDPQCDALTYYYSGSGINYTFSVPNSYPSGTWSGTGGAFGSSTINLGNKRTVDYDFPAAGTYTICYDYRDNDGRLQRCCKTIELVANPYDCDNIFYSFDRSSNRYELNIPGIGDDNVQEWRDDDNNVRIGTSSTVTIPIGGDCVSRNFTVTFFDPAVGYYRLCCLSIFICDPYDCNLIQQSYDANSNTFRLSLPGVGDSNILRWQDDGSGQNLTSGSDDVVVPNPGNGNCRQISVYFYDPGCNCYRVCCIEVCGQPDACAIISDEELSCNEDLTYDYSFTFTNNSGRSNIEAKFIILAPAGIAFDDCFNVTNRGGIDPGTQDVTVTLKGCAFPLEPGTEVTIMTMLHDFEGGSEGWCCHADTRTITIPDCDLCQGEPQDISCPGVVDPVCGCNDVTYNNACEARRAGVFQTEPGRCPSAVTCDNPTNLTKNGAFEGGYWAFQSDLGQACYCNEASYCINSNARNKCSSNISGGMNNRFLIIQGMRNQVATIWEQAVDVTNGRDYRFAVDVYGALSGSTAPTLELMINGIVIETLSSQAGVISTLETNWTATSTGPVRLEIRQVRSNLSLSYGIDNVKFERCGNTATTSSASSPIEIESDTQKEQAYTINASPNPFAHQTTISFSLPQAMEATIIVRDVNGIVVLERTADYDQGTNTLEFKAAYELPSGVYVYELQTADFTQSKSMILLQE